MIPIYKPSLTEADRDHLLKAFDSGWISSKGDYIRKFEESLGQFIGKKYAISTSSGTTALHLALVSLGIERGDEVIVPNLTFAATANAVLYQGAIPVFVDVESDGWGIDPELLKKEITSKTKAIIAVHLYGNPSKISEIKEIATSHDIYLIEDCAEALGASYENKLVGNLGDISCFSFYGNKVITTGEGGMCLTDNRELTEKLRIHRDHGMTEQKRYWHEEVGYNYRMTNIQASIGFSQMKRIHSIIRRKREIALYYRDHVNSTLSKQEDPEGGKSIFWLYSVIARSKQERDGLIRYMYERGVEARPFFFPLSVMPPYSSYVRNSKLLNSSVSLSERGLNLPSFPDISEQNLNYVVNTVNSYFQ